MRNVGEWTDIRSYVKNDLMLVPIFSKIVASNLELLHMCQNYFEDGAFIISPLQHS